MRHQLNILAKIATVVAWVLTGVDILPDGWLWDLSPDVALYFIAVACVGSYWWIARTHARPADETFAAGVEVGRRNALLEQECANVTRLAERQLRVVDRA
jgi:hypothetical protein